MDLHENCQPVDISVLDQNCSKEVKCEPNGEIIGDCPTISQQIAISELNRNKSGTKWFIKALVVNKSSIRTYFDGGVEGKFFSLELCDESSTIRMVCFGEVCDMFYTGIQVNKMYYFGNYKIRDSDRRYNALPHNFELLLEKYSYIKPIEPLLHKHLPVPAVPVKLWTLSEVVQDVENNCTRDMLAIGEKRLKMFRVQGLVLEIEEYNFVYEACPSEYCNKKVEKCYTDVDVVGFVVLYRCMKCKKYYHTFEYRYMLKVKIADLSSCLWITLFDEAERFLNISVHDLMKMRETNYEKFQSYFSKRIREIHTFTLQTGMVLHGDEIYLNAICDSFTSANSKEPSVLSSLRV